MAATRIALDFAEALTQKFITDERYARSTRHISVIAGNRFDKLVAGEEEGEQGCAYAFIERETGDLHRAASWGRPEPEARYEADELMTSVLEEADPYATFLNR